VCDIQDEYQLFFEVYGVKYAVVPDSITKNGTQLTFQPFDISSKEGITPQFRINIALDSGIIWLVCA
jgi:hypothetical protein